jgi:hypothetical protein
MGENSDYLVGHKAYTPWDTIGNATGLTITSNWVYSEDINMFSVLVNRAATTGYPKTIGAVATEPGAFTGSAAGKAKYLGALGSSSVSSLCNDLTDVVEAMNYVLRDGSQLSAAYLYWKAIDQGNGIMHIYHPGDIYVANTVFGTVNR